MLASHFALVAIIRGSLGKSLRRHNGPCYGSRLKPFVRFHSSPASVSNKNSRFCPQHFSAVVISLLVLALFVFARTASAQAPVRPKKADLPAENEIRFQAVTQDSNGPWRYLRRGAKIETSDMLITADEID